MGNLPRELEDRPGTCVGSSPTYDIFGIGVDAGCGFGIDDDAVCGFGIDDDAGCGFGIDDDAGCGFGIADDAGCGFGIADDAGSIPDATIRCCIMVAFDAMYVSMSFWY